MALVLYFLGWGINPARAATIFVDPLSGGDCSAPNYVNCSLQEALTVSEDNGEADTIRLVPGEYSTIFNGSNPFTYESDEGHSLSIVGSGPGVTVIEAEMLFPSQVMILIVKNRQANLTMEGVTIRNGVSSLADIDNAGGLTIELGESDIVIDNCEFLNNFTGSEIPERGGGGINAFLGMGSLTFTNNFITGNDSAHDSGGANFFVGTGELVFSGNQVVDNEATHNYGGVSLLVGTGNITFEDNTFEDNVSHADTGGVRLLSGTGNLQFNRNTFLRNMADQNAGGASLVVAGTATVNANFFQENHAKISNGGLNVQISGFAPFGNKPSIIFTNNILFDNLADNDTGGARIVAGGNRADVTNNTVVENTALVDGGGLTLEVNPQTETNLYNNVVYGNNASILGKDIFIVGDEADGGVFLFNNNFKEFCYSTGECDSSVLGPDQGNNQINVDPQLIDPAAGIFYPEVGSPVIDAGTLFAPSLPPKDQVGNDRVFGDEPDLGALETGPLYRVDPQEHNYGEVQVGTGVPQIFTLINDSSLSANISTIFLNDPQNYVLDVSAGDAPCGATSFILPSGVQCTLEVTFLPTVTGVLNTGLNITQSGPYEGNLAILLLGTGIPGPDGGGCGCNQTAMTPHYSAWFYFLLLPLFLAWRRRCRNRVSRG